MPALIRTALSFVVALSAGAAFAQAWPSKPIRVFVGYPVGTSPDLGARISSTEMGKRLGVNFVVENRPGANGILALQAAKAAEPDGYTFSFGGITNVHPMFLKTNPLVLNKDLAPLADITAASWVALARANLGIRTWTDMVAYSKANPGKVNYGSVANTIDLFMVMLKARTGMDYTPIRYNGAPVAQLLNGEIDFYIGTITGLMPQVQAGKINVILATVKPEVLADQPVQTVADLGLPSFAVRSRFGFLAPMGTPREIIQRLNTVLAASAKTAELIDPVRKLGIEVEYLNAEQQLKDYEAQMAFFAEAARISNFQPQ